jgi:hypothetical protein
MLTEHDLTVVDRDRGVGLHMRIDTDHHHHAEFATLERDGGGHS